MTARRERVGARLAALGLTALVGLLAPRTSRAQSIPVTVGGQTSSLVGVTFDVPLTIDMSARSELLGSFALTLRWNPAVLQLVSGQSGDFGDVTVNEDSLATGVMFASGARPSGVGGKVIVGIGRFRPLVADTTTFRLTVTELYAAQTFADLTASAAPSNRAYCPALGRYGDLDGDGAANSRDALIALSAAVGLDVSTFNVAMGDVDGNGKTEARDALIILSYGVGLDVGQFNVFTIAPGACAAGIVPTLTVDPGDVTVVPGQEVDFAAIARDASGNPLTVTDVSWRSSDDRVVAIGPSGTALAVDTGVATVTATRSGGATASATVTVLRHRGVVWVDALAMGAKNQIGDVTRPYATIQQGVDAAAAGDTVRVRAGTYDESVNIQRSVIVQGDTSLGGTRPFVTTTASPYGSAFAINGGARVELHSLRLDTLYQGVTIADADTVLIRDLEVRTRADALASVAVQQVGVLLVQRSRLFGPGVYDYGTNAVLLSGAAGVVAVDSSLVADYGTDALALSDVDSLVLRDNVIRDNYGWGVNVCNGCSTSDTTHGVAAVVARNRITGNQYGQLQLSYYRSAAFRQNVFGGSPYYTAVTLDGHGGSVASFVADSFNVQNTEWLAAYRYDSLSVDSVDVVAPGSSDYLDGGRIAVIRHSVFRELTSTAIGYDAYPRDSTALRFVGVEFRGPDSASCYQCGDAVYGYGTASIVADSVTATNLYYLFSINDTHLHLDHTVTTGTYRVVDIDCGSAAVSNLSATDAYWGVVLWGCASSDSVSVTSSRFERGNQGVYADYAFARVEGSSFTDLAYPIEADYGSLVARRDSVVNPYNAVSAYGYSGVADSLIVDSLYVANARYEGVYASYMDQSRITRSTFVNSWYPIDMYDGNVVATDNVIAGPQGNPAVYADTYGYGSAAFERNTVACGAGSSSGIAMYGRGADSSIARDNVISGCISAGLRVDGAFVEVRENTVTNAGPYSDYGITVTADSGAVLAGNAVSGKARYGSILANSTRRAAIDSNTVSGSVEVGILAWYVDTALIRGNTVSNHDTLSCCYGYTPGAIALYHYTAAANGRAEIVGNRIARSASNGIVVQRGYPTDTVTVVVDSNAVKGAKLAGIRITDYTHAVLTRNAVDSTGRDGIYVDRAVNDSATIRLNYNNITRSDTLGVRNLDPIHLDATNNYWGDPSGPACDTCSVGLGDSLVVTGANAVAYLPFLLTPQSDVPTPAPSLGLIAAAPISAARAVRAIPAFTPDSRPRAVEPVAPRPRQAQPVEAAPAVHTPLPRFVAPTVADVTRVFISRETPISPVSRAAEAVRARRAEEHGVRREAREAAVAEQQARRDATRAQIEARRAAREAAQHGGGQ